MSDGSAKYTAVWDGLWYQKHAKKMGNSIFLFGYLLSKVNGKGQVQITYQAISKDMNVPIRTLGAWMQTLKQQGYLSIQKTDSMSIQIANFRSTKKADFGEAVMQDVAEPKEEVMQDSAEPLCKTLPNLLQDPAEPISANSNKQVGSGNLLNVFKIKDKNREVVSQEKSSKKPPANPDVTLAISHYSNEYLRIHGNKPYVNGAVAKTFQILLNTKPIEQVKTLTTDYLSLNDEKLKVKGYPIEWMPSNINRLMMAKKKSERGFVY